MILLQGEARLIPLVSQLLHGLLLRIPDLVPVAIKENATPGLVRVLSEFRPHPHASVAPSFDISEALEPALICLPQLLKYDITNRMGAWQAAIDAGIVTVLSDLLVVDDEPTVVSLLTLLSWLMMATPAGTAGPWGRSCRATNFKAPGDAGSRRQHTLHDGLDTAGAARGLPVVGTR
jgi:hypothetical protein